ncbi:MAG: cobalamin-dependent protein, partial [Elusimicrobia bacterium]|nr:cobalamin-dependent protein [Elusimicrobiota bacterium]
MSARPGIEAVFYYTRANRFSFNPLLGVLESLPGRWPANFPTAEAELHEAVAAALARSERVLACFSFASPQLWTMLPLARGLRDAHPARLVLVAGGPHPSADPEACFAAGFDLVVRGEGEAAFARLCEDIAAGGAGRVPGTCWLQDGRVRGAGAAAVVDLDACAPFGLGKFGPVEITRGCPYACAFCQTSALHGRRPRHRSPAAVGRWARELSRLGLR